MENKNCELGVSNNLRQYYSEIDNIKPLTEAEKAKCLSLAKQGDMAAKDILIKDNLRLVRSIALAYYHKFGQKFAIDDLIQEGNLALFQAIDHFDNTRGYQFSTYATYWIQHAIITYVNDNRHQYRMPMNANKYMKKIELAVNSFYQRNNRLPSFEETAKEANMNLDTIITYYGVSQNDFSIDNLVFDDTDDIDYTDVLTDNNSDSVEDIAVNRVFMEEVISQFKILSERERNVLIWRYGLLDGKCCTLVEIAKRMGKTKELVRMIELSATKKLSRMRKLR